MKVTKRGVDSKRHTKKWLVGGKWITRLQAVRLAEKNKIEDVCVRRGGNDNLYIASLPGRTPLYDLPEKVLD